VNAQIVPGIGERQVTTVVGSPPVRVFRTTFTLRFATAGADEVVLDAGNVRLSGTFKPFDYDARSQVGPLGASLTGSAPVVARLDAPRQVQRVQLPNAKADSGAQVEFYRMDGDTPATAPTVTANVGTGASASPAKFTDARFGMRYKMPSGPGSLTVSDILQLHVRGLPTLPRLSLAPPPGATAATPFWNKPGEHAADIVLHPHGDFAAALEAYFAALATPLAATTDVMLLVESDAPCRFVATQIAVPYKLLVNSFAWPLLHESDVKDVAALSSLLHSPATPLSHYVRLRLSAESVRALARGDEVSNLIDDLNVLIQGGPLYSEDLFEGVPLSQELDALVATNPAGAARVSLNRMLLEAAWPRLLATRGDKRVLRFPGERPVTRSVEVKLPPGASIAKGEIRATESFSPERPPDSQAGDGPPLEAPPDDTRGWRLTSARWAAAALTPAAPVVARGVRLATLSVRSGTELTVELQEDVHGRPSGRVVATATVTAAGAGPAWLHARWPEAVTLQPAPYWVAVTASAGDAVWLARPFGPSSRVAQRSAGAPAWDEEHSVDGFGLVADFLSVAGEATSESAATVSSTGITADTRVEPDGTRVWDVAPLLLEWLSEAGGEEFSMAFTSAVPGTISVTPPEVVYELV
jgi:hypothetical protein